MIDWKYFLSLDVFFSLLSYIELIQYLFCTLWFHLNSLAEKTEYYCIPTVFKFVVLSLLFHWNTIKIGAFIEHGRYFIFKWSRYLTLCIKENVNMQEIWKSYVTPLKIWRWTCRELNVKIDFPCFDILGWVFKVEEFFEYYDTLDEQRLTITAIYFEKEVVP